MTVPQEIADGLYRAAIFYREALRVLDAPVLLARESKRADAELVAYLDLKAGRK